MINDYISLKTISPTKQCIEFVTKPYGQAFRNFSHIKLSKSFGKGLGHFVVGILLLIPVINSIVLYILHSILKATNSAAIKIQALTRDCIVRRRKARRKKGMIRIQALIRGFLTRRRIRNHAATKIQALARGYIVRRRVARNKAATKIQALARGYIVRQREVRNSAAIKIQAVARGFLVRRRRAKAIKNERAKRATFHRVTKSLGAIAKVHTPSAIGAVSSAALALEALKQKKWKIAGYQTLLALGNAANATTKWFFPAHIRGSSM